MIKNSKIFLIRPLFTLSTPIPLIYITFFHRYKNNIYHKIREMKNGGLMDGNGNLGYRICTIPLPAFVQKWWCFDFLRAFFEHFVQLSRSPEVPLVTAHPLENLSSRRHPRYPVHYEVPCSQRGALPHEVPCSETEVPPGARGRLALPRVPGLDGILHHPPIAPAIRLGPIRK